MLKKLISQCKISNEINFNNFETLNLSNRVIFVIQQKWISNKIQFERNVENEGLDSKLRYFVIYYLTTCHLSD